MNELRGILGVALARGDRTARTLGRARALLAAAQLAGMQGDYQTAQRLATQALELTRSLGLKRDVALVFMAIARFDREGAVRTDAVREARVLVEELRDRWALAIFEFMVGDAALERGYRAATTANRRSLELFRAIGDALSATLPLLSLGRLACVEGDYARARALVEEAVAIRRRWGAEDPWRVAIALISLGEVLRCAGDAAAAVSLFEEALRYGRDLGDDSTIAWALHNLGHVALADGDLRAAALRFRDSVALRRIAAPRGPDVARGFAGVASVALGAGLGATAARLFGAADALVRANGMVLAPCDELVRHRDGALTRATLDSVTFDGAFTAGGRADPAEIEATIAAIVDDLNEATAP